MIDLKTSRSFIPLKDSNHSRNWSQLISDKTPPNLVVDYSLFINTVAHAMILHKQRMTSWKIYCQSKQTQT
jgi:hypothetical protein